MSIKIDRTRMWMGLSPSGALDVDVSLSFLDAINKLREVFFNPAGRTAQDTSPDFCFVTTDSFADKAIEGFMSDHSEWLIARLVDGDNMYFWEFLGAQTTADELMAKLVAGSRTNLATTAIDITGGHGSYSKLSCAGTTLKGFRFDLATPKQTVTDTTFASGRFGKGLARQYYAATSGLGFMGIYGHLRAPASPSTKPLAYFEVPIKGDGSMEDPFTIQVPEEIAIDWSLNPFAKKKYDILKRKGFTDEEIDVLFPEVVGCKVNRLSFSWSALIPTDKSGRPIHSTAIVKIIGGSPQYVHPLEKRISALKEIQGVRELKREEAIDLALKMDDKLHIHDLVPCTKHDLGGKCFLEYRDWRIATIGEKPEFADTDIRKRYVKEEKGW
jgi:hypothetical protein